MSRTTPATPTVAGKVVVITGGARGIGLATARKLHADGARVAIGDVDEATVKTTGADLGLEVAGLLDVTAEESFDAFLDQVERTLGPIDVLVNNAGIMPLGRLADEPDAVTRRVLDINVYGVILGSKLALRRMLARGSGHVINVASLAGKTPMAGAATYCASKYAVLGFTDTLRMEYHGTGVEFSAVLPTFTNTELIAGTAKPRLLRNAEPHEVAAAVADLILHPRPEVAVTRIAGVLVDSQNFVPRRVSERLGRMLGVDHAFTDDVDPVARRSYEDRARGV
ncbi:SDR family oxidoreductase [Skermania piniformis]|uniref:SDR family oxidoreductase n=1 Tax=Skermania pinensis TaxID=39122 RepID=A0ABX8S881_9ACTN|nr:SDR family oxidoreductase [Skermania piniformis]QXQ13646.1 SDR family oxidoreductase [Skermania piniformis]